MQFKEVIKSVIKVTVCHEWEVCKLIMGDGTIGNISTNHLVIKKTINVIRSLNSFLCLHCDFTLYR